MFLFFIYTASFQTEGAVDDKITCATTTKEHVILKNKFNKKMGTNDME